MLSVVEQRKTHTQPPVVTGAHTSCDKEQGPLLNAKRVAKQLRDNALVSVCWSEREPAAPVAPPSEAPTEPSLSLQLFSHNLHVKDKCYMFRFLCEKKAKNDFCSKWVRSHGNTSERVTSSGCEHASSTGPFTHTPERSGCRGVWISRWVGKREVC